jgi:tetratricopeptide (TPR) repeat protein
MIARSNGADGETAKGIMAGTMLLGMIGVLLFAGSILSKLTPKSPMMQAMEQYESALRRGQYETLIPLVDKLMHDLPNWETRIPGAAAYAQAGRLEEAERITREAMKELANPQTEMQRAMFKPLMGGAFGLLTEIYMMGGRFDEAETSLKRAQEFDDDSYAVNNTTAKFHLYRGQPETALPFIDRAEKGYLKAKEPVSAYNKALRAWTLALIGRSAEADALMVEVIRQVPVEHYADIAEVYLLGGYVARAQGKRSGARRSFETAAKFDPNGIYGQIAERELKEN